MKKLILILLLLFSAIGKADINVSGEGEKLIFANNSQTITFAASPSMSESVNYILWAADGDPGQTIITDGAGVLSFADVNAVAGTHDILSVTHDDAIGELVTKGDIIFGNATPKWDDLPIGSENQILRVTSSLPDWVTLTEGLAIDITNGAGSITLDFDPTELTGNRTWGDASTDTIVWTWNRATGTDPTMAFGDNLVTFNTVVTIEGLGTGGQTDYDLKVGDVDGSPTYGMIQLGNACIGRTSFRAGDMDIDGSVIYRNISGPVTSEIEHVFVESTGSTTRFALAKAGVGNATYNSRSMLIAGPAPADTNYVKVSYWQTTNNIFDNLACDTSGVGADLGVQNDLEVEGTIFVDDVNESTSGVGITFNNSVIVTTGNNITLGSTQWNSADEIDGTKIKDADYGDVDVSAGGAWTVSSVQNDSVALGADTTGNYVASITDGLAIDGGDGGSEGAALTLAFDPTELLGNRTWGDASTDTIVWTWDRATGTDPTMTFGNNLITLNGDITTTGHGTFGELTVDNFNFNGVTLTISTLLINSGDGIDLNYGEDGTTTFLSLQPGTGFFYFGRRGIDGSGGNGSDGDDWDVDLNPGGDNDGAGTTAGDGGTSTRDYGVGGNATGAGAVGGIGGGEVNNAGAGGTSALDVGGKGGGYEYNTALGGVGGGGAGAAGDFTINIAGAGAINANGNIVMGSTKRILETSDASSQFGFNQADLWFLDLQGTEFVRFAHPAKGKAIVFNDDDADIDVHIFTDNGTQIFTVDAALNIIYLGDGGVTNYTSVSASGTITQFGAAIASLNATDIGDGTNEAVFSGTGDLSFTGTAGFIYGHMNIPGVDVTVDTSATANPVEVKDDGTGVPDAGDGWASTYQNEVTFAVSDLHYQTVTIAGTYEVIWDMSPKTNSGGGTEIHGGIMIDDVAVRDNGENHAHVFNNNDNISISSVGTIDCPNGNEEISLWVANDAAQKTIIEHGNMRIKLIGGT